MDRKMYYPKVMDSPNKTMRKVRFTLPEHENNFVSLIQSRNSPAVHIKKQSVPPPSSVDESKVHGTCCYINGTLNFVQDEFKPITPEKNGSKTGQKIENKTVDPKQLRPCIKTSRKSREVRCTTVESESSSTTKSLPLHSSLSKKFHYFIRSKSESRGRKTELPDRNRKSSAVYSLAAFYFPDNMKTNSMPKKSPRQKQILTKSDILTASPSVSLPIPVHEHVDKLPNVTNMYLNGDPTDKESIPQISTRIQQLPHMNQMVNNDANLQNFTQFFDRWRQLESAASRKRLSIQANEIKINGDALGAGIHASKKLLFHKKMPDAKSFSLLSSNYRKRIMNIEKTPLVTSLIRACKNADKDELMQVMCSIEQIGISTSDLNSVDQNGRTAISYICATSLTKVLDFLLKQQGIDVNKADKDGNTPLHFAAEAGLSEMINMLITRSRSLKIDAKNIFGMTPLMKAAIQGRTDCAKRLMLANASPFEKDSVRGLTPQQWARFCCRIFCADALGELIKKRNSLQQSAYLRKELVKRDKIAVEKVMPYKASDPRKDGLVSKLRNILPFYRPKLVAETDSPDLHCSMDAVPTVEITPANNHQLINKYASLYAAKKYVATVDEFEAPPKVPLRRKSSNE
ncbi:uncharacterized protein LOC119084847 isoform X2 [Bradysia coprophila]|uniref:uncharacterized protein LOC119084847 isoform X2 n=1 Tax=Bradysia coprophila TaxID=38358 RepID=UPI00187DD3A4|nr:uncharacterized protein LOC119084847 isoform X2 [Bradysia coprophila]XP_037050857.1 uncharacterized protein LOC119084847 isoform X2 [Bradysia coprophila]